MKLLGKILYVACYPGLFVVLNGSRRTRLIVLHNNQVVLVRPFLGMGEYLLPGGGIHRRETPQASAVRELREETGICIDESELQHLQDTRVKTRGISIRVVVFTVHLEHMPQTRSKGLEIAEVRLMPLDQARSVMLPAEARLLEL